VIPGLNPEIWTQYNDSASQDVFICVAKPQNFMPLRRGTKTSTLDPALSCWLK
jgi:hypothetical protein